MQNDTIFLGHFRKISLIQNLGILEILVQLLHFFPTVTEPFFGFLFYPIDRE